MSILSAGPDTLHLSSVRVRGAGDALRARQRLEAAMADVRPSSLGLPEHALLLVRRVATGARLPTDQPQHARSFGRALLAELSRCAAVARRPWLHADAASADAVLFPEEAELAACLVRDWLGHRVGERWWWRSVLQHLLPREWLRRHVLARGQILAPAVALLAARGQAAAWMARLEDAEARAGIDAIANAYALAPGAVPPASAQGDAVEGARLSANVPNASPASVAETRAARARVLAVAPEAAASGLAPLQRHLLAVAFSVTRAPAWSRTPQLAIALDALVACVAAGEAPLHRPVQVRAAQRRNSVAAPATASHAPARTGGVRAAITRALGAPAAATGPDEGLGDAHVGTQDAPGGLHPPVAAVARSDAPRSPDASAAGRGAHAPIEHAQGTHALVPPVPDEQPAEASSVHTGFGGIFYLLNVALALRLYADFTAPRGENLALSPWDLLGQAGRAWFGEAFVRDPVWALLAALAGRREAEPPGTGVHLPSYWLMPEDWLSPWDGDCALRYAATRRRLRVWHPAGFVLFDVARDPRRPPRVQARAVCKRVRRLRPASLQRALPAVSAVTRVAGAARWMSWLLPYLHARLARSLGRDEAEADVPASVCHHDAEVQWSMTRVDVNLSLATLPLPMRCAGLDRDPGWIPAAGRAVHFHFA